MTLTVKTQDPSGLLRKIKKAINDGAVRTWSYNARGDFTHKAKQWKEQAWLRPRVAPRALHFDLIPPKQGVKEGVDGVYHGRFAGMLRTHFECIALETTAQQHAEAEGGIVAASRKRKGVAAARRRRTGAAE